MFKVGDSVVWTVDMSDICDMNAIYEIKEHSHGQFKVFLKDKFICWVGDRVFDQEFRLATKEEIAAGHRIDLETLRDCDVSPNCKVIDQDWGCNHNFEEVTKYGDAHKTYMCTICEFRDEQVK